MMPRPKSRMIVCGVMSGTSLDGIDAVLVKIGTRRSGVTISRIAFSHLSFPPGLRSRLLANSTADGGSVEAITRLNVAMGELIADAVRSVARKGKVPLSSVDLIGSHGQTICHLPQPRMVAGKRVRATLQIGDPSVVAARTGIPTVGDFRSADMAHGGQGAPLVPYFDWLMFRSPARTRVLLNIGGIANISFLPAASRKEDVLAFDTGPGNMVVDALMRTMYRKPMDRNGRTALSGRIAPGLLDEAMSHRYFRRRPPKSAGREEFGETFARLFAEHRTRAKADRIATASFVTPLAIYDACQRFLPPSTAIDDLIVSGGGGKNTFFMKVLREFFGDRTVRSSDQFGIPAAEKEAICFAVLAWETAHGRPGNLPSVTGAKREAVLGRYCQP
ncbi:MAG: anhydro-N-acetylmuramic acid kinase [Ignavibacteria bacterium]|nr:anhydro-N-acetylmuramic acid kinase [Ignavibacteria bacterium]